MIYVATRRGKHHKKSEDAVLVGEIILSEENDSLPVPKNGFVCVADGVGGNNGGAYAASFVLENLLQMKPSDNIADIRNALVKVNDLLVEKGHDNKELLNMATTLTGVLLKENSNYLIHVGNTRAYIRQGRYLKQITQDHTVYNWLQKIGRYNEAEMCNKNEITNCFGGGDGSLISKLHVVEFGGFTQLLLTSDGVHEYVDIDLLEDILAGNSSGEEKCNDIINAALVAGSNDDMTVILVCMKEE